MADIKERMQKTVDASRAQLKTIRTGRANPDLLSKIQVDYYGSTVPLNQVASVTAPEPMLLQLSIFDRSAVQAVEKAIQISDLNLTPNTDGNVIRLRIPELTEDRRRDLVKIVKRVVEESKVALRNIRRDEIDALKAMQKDNEISEDDFKREQEDVQKITDDFVSALDKMGQSKESEIMTV